MKPSCQPSLFHDQPKPAPPRVRPGVWAPFEDWDLARMEPRPEIVVPEWLRLPIVDDPL